MSFLIAPRTLEAKQFSKNVPITVPSSKTHSLHFCDHRFTVGNHRGELWIVLTAPWSRGRRTPGARQSNGAELRNCSAMSVNGSPERERTPNASETVW